MNKYELFYKAQLRKHAPDPKRHEDELLSQIKCAGLEVPAREFRFHEGRRWRFDFAYPERKVAIEVEGGIWSGGRHTRAFGFEGDCAKYNEAALAGWLVLRVTPGMIEDTRAIKWIEKALDNVRAG